MSKQAQANNRGHFLIGLMFISIAFSLVIAVLFFNDYKKEANVKSYAELQVLEARLNKTQLDLEEDKKELQEINNYLKDYLKDTIIVNTDTKRVILTRGFAKGVMPNKAYAFYSDGQVLGQFLTEIVLKDISFGKIISYTNLLTKKESVFKAEFK